MPKHTIETFLTLIGIPQRSSLSSILYLIYNTVLIEACIEGNTIASGWVDDVCILAEGKTEIETI